MRGRQSSKSAIAAAAAPRRRLWRDFPFRFSSRAFNSLLANCVVFHTALDISEVLRNLVAEGWEIKAATVAELSPTSTSTSPASACMPPTS